MIKFYFHTNNPAKRRAEKWLTKHGLDFQSRNLNKDPLTRDEVLQLLELSPDGTETLVSERSKATKELYAKHPAPTMNQLIDAIQETPQILKSPLIVSGHKMLTGFNADKMGGLVPHQQRRLELSQLLGKLNGRGSSQAMRLAYN